jgi:hypothetical protein
MIQVLAMNHETRGQRQPRLPHRAGKRALLLIPAGMADLVVLTGRKWTLNLTIT